MSFEKGSKEQKEFQTGNKSLALFPVAMSLLASYQSSVTILGYPAEMFLRGTQFWMVIFAAVLASVMAAEVFLPVYYSLSFTSVNEVLEVLLELTLYIFPPTCSLVFFKTVLAIEIWLRQSENCILPHFYRWNCSLPGSSTLWPFFGIIFW